MFAADWGVGQVIWTMIYFFFLFAFIWILITVLIDLFRDHGLSGWAKAGWVILLIFLPLLGTLIYLIARSELNRIMDGFVYGAMVGLGFAVVEDVLYFVGRSAASRPASWAGSSSGSWPPACTAMCSTPA